MSRQAEIAVGDKVLLWCGGENAGTVIGVREYAYHFRGEDRDERKKQYLVRTTWFGIFRRTQWVDVESVRGVLCSEAR